MRVGGVEQVPKAVLHCATGITVTNHPMNKTSASLSLDYLYVWGQGRGHYSETGPGQG